MLRSCRRRRCSIFRRGGWQLRGSQSGVQQLLQQRLRGAQLCAQHGGGQLLNVLHVHGLCHACPQGSAPNVFVHECVCALTCVCVCAHACVHLCVHIYVCAYV